MSHSQPPTPPKSARPVDNFEVAIPLRMNFRFGYEPIRDATSNRFVGRERELTGLVERLEYSHGGSFLLTGYRGVGKTSFVNQVIKRLEERMPVLDVYLNLSRALKPAELMHHIIRRLYGRLQEKGYYAQLSPALQTELRLAYYRTSANMARKVSENWERGLEISDPGSITEAAV